MILAGDIGGTNSRLALFELRRGRLVMRGRGGSRNAERKNLIEIVREFLESESHQVEIACFGVAGPVRDGRVTLTNLNWTLDEKRMARDLKIGRVALINDLVAHAEGTNVLSPRDVVTLNRGKPVRGGNRAIIAPGTGLGEGGLVFDRHSNDYRAFASEGGHSDFAPRDVREVALMLFNRRTLGRCGAEEILSGPGIQNVFKFLTMRTSNQFYVKPVISGRNPEPADITAAAMDGSCPACVAAIEMFTTILFAEAGNLACKTLATGGVYIGGGIPPRIMKFVRNATARRAFADKGPPSIRKLLAAMPIHVIKSPDNALFGAAHYARRG